MLFFSKPWVSTTTEWLSKKQNIRLLSETFSILLG